MGLLGRRRRDDCLTGGRKPNDCGTTFRGDENARYCRTEEIFFLESRSRCEWVRLAKELENIAIGYPSFRCSAFMALSMLFW